VEKLSIEERVAGFKRFFAMSNTEGPLVGFFRDTYYPLKRYRTESFLPEGEILPEDLEVDLFIPEYERLFQLHDETAGDFLWSAAAFWGIPWMEALTGCGVVADHTTGSSRSQVPTDFQGAEDASALMSAELFPYYRKILDYKPLIIWGDLTLEDLDFIEAKLDRHALALLPVVASLEQAERIWGKFKT
jgi:hypothetical protein